MTHGTSMRSGMAKSPKAQGAVDIVRLHVTVIDAEHENQQHLGDEEQAEEERESAQRFLSALLERHVIDLIDGGAERVEGRQHQDRGQDRIDAEPLVHDIGDIGAEDDEGGMRDIDDVENAERDRYADRDRGVESAEQNSGDQRIDQEVARSCAPRAVPGGRSDGRIIRSLNVALSGMPAASCIPPGLIDALNVCAALFESECAGRRRRWLASISERAASDFSQRRAGVWSDQFWTGSIRPFAPARCRPRRYPPHRARRPAHGCRGVPWRRISGVGLPMLLAKAAISAMSFCQTDDLHGGGVVAISGRSSARAIRTPANFRHRSKPAAKFARDARPAFMPSTIASALATLWIATRRLATYFIRLPLPKAPRSCAAREKSAKEGSACGSRRGRRWHKSRCLSFSPARRCR